MVKRWLAIVLIVVFMAGCSIPLGAGKELTPKAQATLFMSFYAQQNKDLQSLSRLKNATDAQKQLFKEKQVLLAKLKPMIDTYNAIVKAGGTPDPQMQNDINNIVNELVAQLGR